MSRRNSVCIHVNIHSLQTEGETHKKQKSNSATIGYGDIHSRDCCGCFFSYILFSFFELIDFQEGDKIDISTTCVYLSGCFRFILRHCSDGFLTPLPFSSYSSPLLGAGGGGPCLGELGVPSDPDKQRMRGHCDWVNTHSSTYTHTFIHTPLSACRRRVQGEISGSSGLNRFIYIYCRDRGLLGRGQWRYSKRNKHIRFIRH